MRDIVHTALNQSEKLLSDILIVDTSGRISTDEELLTELKTIYELAKPQENLLVLDSMMGQQALSVVEAFHQTAPLTGFILTRLDADPRGGVALSAKYQTGLPFVSLDLEKIFRILKYSIRSHRLQNIGNGDCGSLVEKAQKDLITKKWKVFKRK